MIWLPVPIYRLVFKLQISRAKTSKYLHQRKRPIITSRRNNK